MRSMYTTVIRDNKYVETPGVDFGAKGLTLWAINSRARLIVFQWPGGSVWGGRGMPRTYKASAFIVGIIESVRQSTNRENEYIVKWDTAVEFDVRNYAGQAELAAHLGWLAKE